MTDFKKNRALLPGGFADLLPPAAAKEARIVSTLMGCFERFGYERVKPPLVEFEDSLFAPGPGEAVREDTFRLMDPLSHKMMGVRSDLTGQIARIASFRLADEARPLRLTYANDVLRTRGSHQRTQRQFCQVGCEIIGEESHDTDVESCVVALSALAELGLGGLSIDLSYPTLVGHLFDLYDLDEDARVFVRGALRQRDFAVIGRLENSELSQSLMGLMYASGPADQVLSDLRAVPLQCGEAMEDVQNLCAVYERVAAAIKELGIAAEITIDPVEPKDFKYYSGIGFSLFAQGARAELGSGGRYMLQPRADGTRESATGFTLYMDAVCRVAPAAEVGDMVYVPQGESWGVIRGLQNEGWIVVRGAGQYDAPAKCTHVYENGQVRKRESE